jgi:CBS domain-containing protein
MARTVREVMHRKSLSKGFVEGVRSVAADATLMHAVTCLNEYRIGALLVLDDGARPIGILSERDVLRRAVEARRDPDATLVEDVMTPDPITISPSVGVDEAMRLMTKHRVRHLPVVVRDELIGLVSIGDLVWFLSDDLQSEVSALHSYIHGPAIIER